MIDSVRQGSLAIVPTDTCYGVACDAFDATAVARLKTLRGMHHDTVITVLVADIGVVDAVATELSPIARRMASRFWPGPLTMMFDAQPSLSWQLGIPKEAVAVRIPAHQTLRALLKECGPMAVSQASPVGGEPPFTLDDALQALRNQVEIAVEGGRLSPSRLSTFIDLRKGNLEVLRVGSVPMGDLLRVADAAAQSAQDISLQSDDASSQ